MSDKLRIASFNLENFGDEGNQQSPLATRIAILRPQIERLRADILCLQEVNGQPVEGQKQRDLSALKALLQGTPYQGYEWVCTEAPGPGRGWGGYRYTANFVITITHPAINR